MATVLYGDPSRSDQSWTASVEPEVPPRRTKRVKIDEINSARLARSPTLQANDQQDTPEVANIKHRIRAMLPAPTLMHTLLTFETKLRPKLMRDNTIFTSFRPSVHNAVLVYKYKALDIYIVADLRGDIIPVAKTVWLVIGGGGADRALFNSKNIKIKFFETANQVWKLLEWRAVLSESGVTDGSHIKMPWDFAVGPPA
ncbi:MAG: hypothetical protein Q9212_006903 [Teloschistes hypoglaucus]